MITIKSIVEGKFIEQKNNLINYNKFFLKEFTNEEVYVNEITDIKLFENCFSRRSLTTSGIKNLMDSFHKVIKLNFNKYNLLLSVECGISLKQSENKINQILGYIEGSLNEFTKYENFLKENSLYLMPKGKVLISISGSDPFEGMFNSLLPALFTQNIIYIKPSRKSSLLIYSFFIDIMKCEEFVQSNINLIFPSNELFEEMINQRYFDYVYWTGSIQSTHKIGVECAKNNIDFSFDGAGVDMAYIDESFTDLDFLKNIIVNSITNLNGKNCNAIKFLFIQEEVFENIKKIIIDITKSIKKLENIQDSCDYQIGPLSENEIRYLNETENKLGKFKKISSFKDEDFYFSPKVYISDFLSDELINTEFFGPIMIIKSVKNFEEVIRYQNASNFGLSFSVFSKCLNIEHMLNNIRVGRFNINIDPLDVSFFEPWGGIKNSGSRGVENWIEKFSNKSFMRRV